MSASLAQIFRFDGKEIPFEAGDTLGSALHRADVKVLGRSMKYHRPRGLYCCTGSCASCFVDVDGVPNVPACMAAAGTDAEVRSQNRIGSAKHDLLGVVDKVYPDGFDPHGAFTRPRMLNQVFLRAVRFMSGWGRAPEPGDRPAKTPRRHTLAVDEIIVGAGLHGLRRAQAAAADGRRIVLVEELPDLGGSAQWDPSETEARTLADAAPIWEGVDVWTDSVAFGLYGDVVAVHRGDDLWEVTAERITVATGRNDGMPMFPGNDRPGILSLRGARRLWYGHGVLPGRRIVGHGDPLPLTFVADLQAAGAQVVAEGLVEAAHGAPVRRADMDDSSYECDVIICNVPGVPRIGLLQQAGCELTWRSGWRPATDDGRTSRPDMFAAFGGAA